MLAGEAFRCIRYDTFRENRARLSASDVIFDEYFRLSDHVNIRQIWWGVSTPESVFFFVSPMRIAILEDEPVQQELLVRTLGQQSGGRDVMHCQVFDDGAQLQRLLRRESFDLLIFDWSVPSLDGLELLRWLRTWKSNRVPVLMLSSRGAEQDVAEALMAGADDYVIKPLRPLELRARVRRLVHGSRGGPAGANQSIGPWRLDASARSISYRTAPDAQAETHVLTAREFQLVQLLFNRLGQTVSRAHLLEAAGYETEEAPSRTLDSHMYRLRRKLQLDAGHGVSLRAVYGQGYCLDIAQEVAE
ncbi:MAG: response regulator transcription factor [Pseudomonadota bacterium]|nr:response regulator transcription factor [Pseudomonadota bacterium]